MKTITITLTIPDGVAVDVVQQPAAGVVPLAPAAAAPSDKTVCKHGQRIHKAGTNKSGKPYDGYFCPEDQCSPEWNSAR